MEKQKKHAGITLIALVITVIVMLILAGVSINFIFGNEGIFSKAQIAVDRYKQATNNEQIELAKYDNEIDIYATRDVTLTSQQYNELIGRIEALEAKTIPKTIWTGNTSSGTITLNNNESIYNYSYLIFTIGNNKSAIVAIDKNGMTTILGGTNGTHYGSNGVEYYGFYVSAISTNGNQLTLTRCGYGNGANEWSSSISITKIEGLL